MPVFMTKKQKALMRARRRKRKRIEGKEQGEKVLPKNGIHDDNGSTSNNMNHDPSKPQTITVPARLTPKEAKKFRKDARRKAKKEGMDESLITFVTEGESISDNKEPESTAIPPHKKQKRSFPRINDLLEEQKKTRQQEQLEEVRKQAEAKLPDEIKSRYIALDCEMVGIGADGKQSALARVSLVDWHGEVVLDTFVKVPSRVTDFRTHVSGVTAKHLHSDSAMELHACRQRVGELLNKKILVGHALKNDLQALLLNHPKTHIRDTAKYRPFQRASGRNGGKWRPRKLRDLVKEHLGQDIQVQGEAHDSVEDARSTMNLFKLVRESWERQLEKRPHKIK